MKNVFYLPFIGKNYEQGFKNKKVLVVGASHYCNENCEGIDCPSECEERDMRTLTIDVIEGIRDRVMETYTKTFTSFERAMVGDIFKNEQERIDFWESIAFFNYCQRPLSSPNDKYNYELLSSSFDAFKDVINEYKPDIIITWGKNVENIISEKINCTEITTHEMGKIYSFNNNGTQIIYCPIQHPSVGFSWENWNIAINKALNY